MPIRPVSWASRSCYPARRLWEMRQMLILGADTILIRLLPSLLLF